MGMDVIVFFLLLSWIKSHSLLSLQIFTRGKQKWKTFLFSSLGPVRQIQTVLDTHAANCHMHMGSYSNFSLGLLITEKSRAQ